MLGLYWGAPRGRYLFFKYDSFAGLSFAVFSLSPKKCHPSESKGHYGTDPRAAKAAKKFNVDCERSGMHISIPSGMKAKGYDDDAAKDDTLKKQVPRLAVDMKQKFAFAPANPREAVAATSMLVLAAPSNAMRRIPLASIGTNVPPVVFDQLPC
jgi:hypothetical protein